MKFLPPAKVYTGLATIENGDMNIDGILFMSNRRDCLMSVTLAVVYTGSPDASKEIKL